MSGIVSSTGARSGLIGTTVGTPAAGGVRQFVQNTTNTETNPNSSSEFIVTDMDVSITPEKSDSRILVTFSCGGMVNEVSNAIAVTIKRVMSGSTTVIRHITRYGYIGDANGWFPIPIYVNYLDAPTIPSTPVVIKYELYMKRDASGYFEINANATTADEGVVTAMELAPN